eukprot:CAMPEP_0174376632 /NCGR_PEP_ID=MMETSP0811_2-20130205/118791_1 /TAXON_ID=73025 ORGANISM="Eutreptiella gymnastica-like, Strain CCMP1594" /NCGR_SAMPLE_ID=MMETSP0811_2 /ASSEMBLY_ACC=CAM_ASM_000667 /LENGTH=108 /DNA_ID=CAMNT_0015527967 /DNA_START=225 /DNA_END=552 /DNA_ORIENTATION=-
MGTPTAASISCTARGRSEGLPAQSPGSIGLLPGEGVQICYMGTWVGSLSPQNAKVQNSDGAAHCSGGEVFNRIRAPVAKPRDPPGTRTSPRYTRLMLQHDMTAATAQS